MKRNTILQLLSAHTAYDEQEAAMALEAIQFIRENRECFERSLLIGHVTGSAWIVNPERTHALLIHHKKLDKWFQPGGHCDGDADVAAVALKEATEETGLRFRSVSKAVFDVDNHIIPARNQIPAHIHYDIRFLLETDKELDDLESNEEVNAVKWIRLEDVHLYNSSDSIMRMVHKLLK
jgi:8-oxo-dGTP pyrophosphatase MutT (NUDIX family)